MRNRRIAIAVIAGTYIVTLLKGTWVFSAGPLLGVGVCFTLLGSQAFDLLGLRASRIEIARALKILFFATTILSLWIAFGNLGAQTRFAISATQYFTKPLQAFADEVFWRGLIFLFLVRHFPRASQASLLLFALLMSFAQTLGFRVFDNAWLSTMSLVTLFFSSFALNILVLKRGNIWMAWSLHSAIAISQESFFYLDKNTQTMLSNRQVIDATQGTLFATLLAIGFFFWSALFAEGTEGGARYENR